MTLMPENYHVRWDIQRESKTLYGLLTVLQISQSYKDDISSTGTTPQDKCLCGTQLPKNMITLWISGSKDSHEKGYCVFKLSFVLLSCISESFSDLVPNQTEEEHMLQVVFIHLSCPFV